MGTGAEAWIVPAIISAIGTGASVYQTKKVANDQDAAAAQGIRAQQGKQREIDQRMSGEIDQLEQSSPEDERTQAMDRFMTQLRATRGEAEGTTTPGVSRYGADTEASQAGIGNYGTKVADILSRISSASEQRRNEAIGMNRANSDSAGIAREANGSDFINQLRMGSIQRNPWVDAAGRLANGVAGGMAGSTGAEIDPQLGGQMARAGNESTVRAPSALLPRRPYNWTDRGSPFGAGGTPPYAPPFRG
jgi:hypothetical protein